MLDRVLNMPLCNNHTPQLMKLSIKDFSINVTFTEEILNGKLQFLCSIFSEKGCHEPFQTI